VISSPVPERAPAIGTDNRVLIGLAVVALAVMGAVVMAWAVRPLTAGSVGPDAAAPVIHFQHLLRLDPIDGGLTQTAKPLLTVLYGTLYGIAGWKGVALASIMAAGLSAALGALLAYRAAGPVAAGFVAVTFTASPVVLRDVALAYAAPWALLALICAGLAVTDARPRWGTAGILLAVAALARPEALAITGVACAAIVAAEIAARLQNRPRPPRRAYAVFLGLAALPVFIVHDAIVMGDPTFWLETAQRNSATAGTVRSLGGIVYFIGVHMGQYVPILVVASLGAVLLGARSEWALLVGLVGATLGIALFFVIVGARGTSVPSRYFGLMDLGFLFAAGIGLAAVDVPLLRRAFRRITPAFVGARVLLPMAAGAFVALVMTPSWFLDRGNLVNAREQVGLRENQAIAMDAIRDELAENPPEGLRVLVPPRLRAQTIVDLGMPLSDVGRNSPGLVNPASPQLEPGTILYHDRSDDTPSPAWASVEIDEPRELGNVRLVPLVADPDREMWVVRVDPR
jgi:hypothetical protein